MVNMGTPMKCDKCGEDNWIEAESDYSQFFQLDDLSMICLTCNHSMSIEEWNIREFEQIVLGD